MKYRRKQREFRLSIPVIDAPLYIVSEWTHRSNWEASNEDELWLSFTVSGDISKNSIEYILRNGILQEVKHD